MVAANNLVIITTLGTNRDGLFDTVVTKIKLTPYRHELTHYVIICTREKEQKEMHTLFPYFFQLYYPIRVSNKQIYHQEVTSVHAEYSIFHVQYVYDV